MNHRAKAGWRVEVWQAAVLAVGLAGCRSVETAAPQKPAMPTIAERAAVAPSAVTPQERQAAARRAIAAGEFSRAVETLNGMAAEERVRVTRELAAELASREPAGAAAFAVALPAGRARAEALEVAARAWGASDAEKALRWTLALADPADGTVTRRTIAGEMVAANPRAAMERLLALPADVRRDETLVFAAAAWARREAERAVEWVRGQPEGDLKRRLLAGVGFELAQSNPSRAIELAATLPAGRDRWLMTGALAQTWVIQDPKAAFAWAKELPAGEARDAAYAGFDTALGVPSSRRIAGGPNTRTSTRTRGGTGAGAVVREGDLPSFDLWLRAQSAVMSRDEAILEYVRQRSAGEPRAIGQWLNTLPPGSTRERATEIYVENVLAVSPRDAASFLRTLPRSEQTPEMLERTAKRLLITDPAAAAMWIQQSDLPEFRKQELLRDVRR